MRCTAAATLALCFASAMPVCAQDAHASMDGAIHSLMMVNRLETWDARPGTGFSWEARGWIGTDLNRIWLRSEGKQTSGDADAANLEVLVAHSTSTWWDVVGGIRHNFAPGNAQTFGAIGVQGLAPQRIEVTATAYLGQGGQTAARFEAEYALLFTNRLVLQPRLEANLYGKTDASRGIGSGLGLLQAELRLRYEISRQFAPYLGWTWERAFGNTAQLRRTASSRVQEAHWVAGIRMWL
jgi:copper resistance protein B